MERDAASVRSFFFLAVAVEGGLAVLAWALGWVLRQPTLDHWRWNAWDAALGVAAALPLLALFEVCVRWPIGPLRGLKRLSQELIAPLFAPLSVFQLAAIALLAGVGEEMLFRGLLQSLAGRWLGVWAGLALASVLFGLLHALTPTYAVLATVMGAYLGWLYLVRDNLLVVALAHALYDGVALIRLVHDRPRPAEGREFASPSADRPAP